MGADKLYLVSGIGRRLGAIGKYSQHVAFNVVAKSLQEAEKAAYKSVDWYISPTVEEI